METYRNPQRGTVCINMGDNLKAMIGKRFGMLTVISRSGYHQYPNGRRDITYRCICDCGNEVDVLGIHLRSGHTKSCGCYRAENTSDMRTTHGATGTRLYTIWKNMRERCNNPNHNDYTNYGGRGIKVCKEWDCDFSSFYNWANHNGYRDELSIDRINVNDGYHPNNCRWVTQKQQCNNTRRNINIEFQNETHTMKEWSEILGINYGTIQSRIYRGWTIERALST